MSANKAATTKGKKGIEEGHEGGKGKGKGKGKGRRYSEWIFVKMNGRRDVLRNKLKEHIGGAVSGDERNFLAAFRLWPKRGGLQGMAMQGFGDGIGMASAPQAVFSPNQECLAAA